MSTSSQSPPPPDPSEFYDDHEHAPIELEQEEHTLTPLVDAISLQPSPSTYVLTRTVAMIKTHALEHRLDIEPRILEAGFEIVKERQMEFDTETDPETLFELFGDNAQFLGDGPVWVYVLERRLAVKVLLTLIPSLNDAVMCSSDDTQAELQIASLFASSPPFPTHELPPDGHGGEFDPSSLRSVSSAVLEALQLDADEGDFDHRAPGFSPSAPKARPSILDANGGSAKPSFKARPLPRTHAAPDIVPRQTRAALLRAGIDKPPPLKARMSTASTGRGLPKREKENTEEKLREKERERKTFAGVPGHKRAETIVVASTAPPVIQPRLTKAAALRLGLEQPTLSPGRKRASTAGSVGVTSKSTGSKSSASNGSYFPPGAKAKPELASPAEGEAEGEETETEQRGRGKDIFVGVPGHKRRETISVTSTSRGPAITPRLNKAAALRKEGGPPPSSFMFRTPSAPKTPGSGGAQTRSSSSLSGYRENGNGTAHRSRPTSAGPSRTSSRASQVRVAPSLNQTSSYGSSNGSVNGASTASTRSTSTISENASPPPKLVRRPSSLQAPTIAPRPNKSAILRAEKQARDAAAPPSKWANASKR
ncbi:hypothetical protein BJ138DRAFT_1141035 [Hygrophoropsis aurantiaca]|uniref:Uncharacterized protein n=1 Tax=Hygrophoropsis aurantiaca TaxID=72124 RepID=A0ACB8ASD7_9AGAM|nr:hypothetical protein BJ138DRAFT_1141035 [Hygrophoropsis aurantiaca]